MKQSIKRVFSLFLVLAMLVGILPGFALTAGAEGGVFVLSGGIEAGKTYVIVADGQYAMTNVPVAAPRSYSGASTTLGAAEVTVEAGVLTSPVDESMLWTFAEVDGFTTVDGEKVWYLNDLSGKFVRRGSMSNNFAALLLEDSVNTTQRYFTFTAKAYKGEESAYALYVNTERSYGTDYAAFIHGGDVSGTPVFEIPDGQGHRSADDPFAFMSNENCSHIQFFELSEGGTVTSTIDFSNEADNGKYAIIGQTGAVQDENGLTVKTTRNAIEPCNGQNTTENANTPEDLIEVPVDGDWTAILHFAFDPSASSNQYYQFFGFFAAMGDDYQNMAGIRCGDKALQDFIRLDGEITADNDEISSAPGLTEACEMWLQIVKEGGTYTCLRSSDGEGYDEMFRYEETGIDASKLVIDAYTGMTAGNAYTLKTLTLITAFSLCDHEYEDETVAPTCEEKGYTLHTCIKCGRSYRSDYVDALGHDFGEYIKTRDYTETERGEYTSYCSRCDATKTRPIAAGNEKPHQDEILFISDVHSARKAKDGFHNLRAVFNLLKENDNFIPEVVCGGGDYIESSTNDTVDWFECYEWLHNYIYEGAPDTYQALTSGNHEWEFSQQSDEMVERLLGQPRVGNSYNSEHFTLFQIGAHMNGTGQEELKDADLAQLAAFLEEEANSGKNRVVFIQTHWPLHYAYNHAWRTTKNADKAIDLVNSYSDRMDICWVWGHNHRHDANRHMFRTRNYYMQISATEYKKILFNYLNAGCLNENGAEQDTGPSGSNYGPGYCLEAKIVDDQLILDYGHVTGAYPDPTQAKFDHNADLLYVEPIQEARESHKEIQLVHYGECEHDYEMTHTDPTCLDWGFNNYKCSKCGLEYHDDVDEPLGHSWDKGKTTTHPTVTERGEKTFTCTRCGVTKVKSVPRYGVKLPHSIDFTDADSAELYEIVGQTAAEQTADGLVTSTTRNAIEDCNGQNSDAQATTPEDLIKVEVFGDWSATLTFEFDPAAASNGYYQFFGFYAMQGEDYQNLAGIRGGDKAFQNFVRLDGTITADDDSISSAPGLDTAQLYTLRLEKSGDNYYCYRYDDESETFTEMFSYEETGIDADFIIIDAYTGMTTGYQFILKSLDFDEAEHEYCKHEFFQTDVAPTCFLAGYTSKVCTACGHARVEDTLPALGHEFENGKCVRCGQPEAKTSGSLADSVTLGGKYVIVSNGYAMTNGGASITGTPVTVNGDVITSAIEENMIWEFTEGSSDRAGEYSGYFLKNGESDYILARASSGGSGSAPLNYNTYTPETAKSNGREYYCFWVVRDLGEGDKAIFLYSEGSGEYAWALRGGETFDAPGRSNSSLDALASENPLRLYEITGEDICQHEYKEEVTAPTCFTRGYTTKTCEKCGQVSVGSVIDVLGHDFVDGVCTRCGEKSTQEPPVPPFEFEDAKNTRKFYYGPVYWAYYHEPQITKGTTDTQFGPEDPCTRGQVVTFLWRAAGEPAPASGNNPFTDVEKGRFYYNAVLWAVEQGITNGMTDDTFEPNGICSRGHIVTFLWRFAGQPKPVNSSNPFTDVAKGKFYYNAVLWAVENGVTNGMSDTTFEPETTCSRGQVVTFLFRAME